MDTKEKQRLWQSSPPFLEYTMNLLNDWDDKPVRWAPHTLPLQLALICLKHGCPQQQESNHDPTCQGTAGAQKVLEIRSKLDMMDLWQTVAIGLEMLQGSAGCCERYHLLL